METVVHMRNVVIALLIGTVGCARQPPPNHDSLDPPKADRAGAVVLTPGQERSDELTDPVFDWLADQNVVGSTDVRGTRSYLLRGQSDWSVQVSANAAGFIEVLVYDGYSNSDVETSPLLSSAVGQDSGAGTVHTSNIAQVVLTLARTGSYRVVLVGDQGETAQTFVRVACTDSPGCGRGLYCGTIAAAPSDGFCMPGPDVPQE
jgi:hypothetical protein